MPPKQFYFSTKAKNAQRGMTLISLMVSVVIMLVGVLTSLRLHNSHEQSVDFIRNATTHNRQLMTALLTVQKVIPAAGFGIAGASDNDVITQFTSGSSSSSASSSIFWRLVENGAVECHGLRDSGVTIDGTDYRKLDLITSIADCNAGSSLTSFSWDGVAANLGLWKIEDALIPYINTNETLFKFELAKEDCTMSRLMASAERFVVKVSAPNTAELNGHVLPSNVVKFCLINVHPS